MIDMHAQKPALKFANVLAAILVVSIGWMAPGRAADCPRPGKLGTSRVLAIDSATTPRVGLKSFPQTLPLDDHEVRRIAAEGHTIGHHTWKHPSLKRMTLSAATEEIDRGIGADEMALHGAATRIPSTPFFRFPGFESTPATLGLLQSRGIVVFGADLWASDWNPMTPAQELKLLTDRLTAAGKGIILLHDSKTRTAAMLPAFLRYLADNHYRVVHLVPAARDHVPATPGADVSRAR
jgi:polysaccharide deacetylase